MRSFIRRRSGVLLAAAVAMLVGGSANRGVAQHFDVFVTSQDGNLIVGGYDDDLSTATIPADQMRVFEGEVVGTGAVPYESEAPGEPGFRASSQATLDNASLTDPAGVYTALTASTPLAFSFMPMTIGTDTRNLFFWDGVGGVSFAPVGSNVALDLTLPGGSGWTESIDGEDASIIAGNTIQTTTTAGAVHTHLFTTIAESSGAPDQGFYLYSLQLEMTGFTSSDPLYFVYGALDPDNMQYGQTLEDFEESHELAATWVQDNLVAPVPEPSTYALLVLGAAAIPLVRRRLRGR